MPFKKDAKDIKVGERIFEGGMEFTVKGKTTGETKDGMNDVTHTFVKLQLDDDIEGYDDDNTGELHIVRSPDSQITVLGPNESTPSPEWKD